MKVSQTIRGSAPSGRSGHACCAGSRRAFTLVELALVLVIMGILAGVAVPRYAGFLTNQRADAAAARIIADLSQIRRQARLTGTSQTVKFNVTGSSYKFMAFPDPDHPSRVYQVSLSEEPYRAELANANFDGDTTLVFDAFGTPDSGGTIVVAVGERMIGIAVDAATGRASILEIDISTLEIIDPEAIPDPDPGDPVELPPLID